MDQQPNVSLKNSAKPSKLLALVALVIAFALPFILVKSFSPKYRSNKYRINPGDRPLPLTMSNITSSTENFSPNHDTIAQTSSNNRENTKTLNTLPQNSPMLVENNWQVVKTQAGDSFATLFKRLHVSSQTLPAIIRDNPDKKRLLTLKPNQHLQFLIKQSTLEKMIIPLTDIQYLTFYREGSHYKSKISTQKMISHPRYLTATVHGSLYSTAKRNNIPYKLVQQMTEIFHWDINFAKDVRVGDQFAIMYDALYIGDKLVSTGNILAVSYKNHGKIFQAVRHTNRAGDAGYYTPEGISLKKAFMRYPLRFSHISSTFSLARNHPILHYKRAHHGIDLAAPIGTPIHATASGHIEIIGRQSGYGNMIKINHSSIYSTVYGHMLKFQKGLSKGDYVNQGQVIGYVGQTGLATGPHCHYEFHIHRQPKNPTTVNLPRGSPISPKELATFRANSNTLLTQLKLFEEKYYASIKEKAVKTA